MSVTRLRDPARACSSMSVFAPGTYTYQHIEGILYTSRQTDGIQALNQGGLCQLPQYPYI